MRSADVIRSAQMRAGYWRQTERMCEVVGIPLRTFQYKLKHRNFTQSDLKRLDMVLHFSDEELGRIIRGGEK